MVIICDLDGVIFDCSHRDHLAPGQTGNNNHWIPHQHPDVVKLDKVIDLNVKVVQWLLQMAGGTIYFLTSRLEINRQVTEIMLQDLGFEHYQLLMLPGTDHRPPHEFKVDGVRDIIHNWVQAKHFMFIEDSLTNVDAVMNALHGDATPNNWQICPIILRPL